MNNLNRMELDYGMNIHGINVYIWLHTGVNICKFILYSWLILINILTKKLFF